MKLSTNLRPRDQLALTWWGCATIIIESGQRSIVIDPYLYPTEPRFEYVFCTHEHYDHAYPPTMQKICTGERFKKAILTRSCTLPSTLFYAVQITFLNPEQLIIFYPKHYDHSRPREFPGPTELRLDGWHIEGVESVGEEPSVPVPVDGPIPQVGYLVRHLQSGISFLHPGDIHQTYPELAELRGKVDLLFLPLGKLGLEEDARALDLIRPRYMVPIHYRYEDNYPIPKLYREDEPPEKKILGHHFPGPDDPDAYIAEMRALAMPLDIEILPLRAGVSYAL